MNLETNLTIYTKLCLVLVTMMIQRPEDSQLSVYVVSHMLH